MLTKFQAPPLSTCSERPRWARRAAAALAAGLAAALVACGGGGVGTGGTGATTAFATGTVGGFGSVVVNGVHYDESGADVFDDDGNASGAGALALGMVVEIHGSVDDDGLTGTADEISYHSELKGPVTAVDAAAGTVTVFGQLVTVSSATVFDDVAGLAGMAVGNVVEVYGFPAADGSIAATRIEREALTVDAFDGTFRVRGSVDNLSGTAPDRRFTVAGVTVTTSSGTEVNGTVAQGELVSVRLGKTAAGDGSYAAEEVSVKSRSYNDADEAEVEGVVSDFTTLSAPFKVNGYPVQLGATVSYEDGVAGDIANGVRIEVEGGVTAGVLVARKVEFDNEENDDDGGEDGSDTPFEFEGVATCSASPCIAPAGSLVIQGVTVQYDALTNFDTGVSLSNLNGANVEVYAVLETGPSGSTLRATRIELDD